MKHFTFLLLIILISFSCKKPDAEISVEEDTGCLIQKITYDDGYYEIYKFGANKKLASAVLTFLDENNKISETEMKYEYNAAGNLIKTTSQDGWIDSYTYDAAGLLTKVVFTNEKGEVYEQFAVTMDAQKRLTKVVAEHSGLTGVYEYKGSNDALSRVEVSYEGKVFDLYEISSYETDMTRKSYSIAITGHPFDPSVFTDSMIYFPFNIKSNDGLPVKGKIWTSYDENWENVTDKLRVYYDFTATRKYNSNNYVTERASKDAIENKTFVKTYSYSNCN